MSYYNLQNLKKYIYWEGLGQNLWSQCGSAAPALAPALDVDVDVDVDQGRREGGRGGAGAPLGLSNLFN